MNIRLTLLLFVAFAIATSALALLAFFSNAGSRSLLIIFAVASLVLCVVLSRRLIVEMDRRNSELLAARQYVSLILSDMLDSLVVVDPDGLIRSVNKATLSLLGYNSGELVGEPFAKLFAEEEQSAMEMLRGLIEEGSVREFEFKYLTKHGHKIPVSCTASVMQGGKPGEVQGIVCIAKDIRERKHAEEALRESEERFRSLFEDMPIGVYRASPDGQMLAANQALLAMLGYNSLEELNAAEADPARIEFLEQVRRRGEVRGQESIWKRKDERPVYVTENAKVVRDEGDAVSYYEGTVEDISQRKKVEQMKNEFVSIVSHELRVPLTSIRGSLSWISDTFSSQLPANIRKLVQIASRNSERMERLINDMLDIDKIESGKMNFKLRSVALMPILEQAIEANQVYGDRFGIKFVLEHGLPDVKVNVDSDRLMQVITNLLSNAAKFSPSGKEVLISVWHYGGEIRVAVIDQGPGIPAEFRNKVFQKFAQGTTLSNLQERGTGLGLSISKAIVERLGGRIGFETEPNAGTTFYFDLPEWRE